MLNPKTGTVWTPDIRPDKIETFEEIYTSEGGEQQAITYKIVDNHPILNKVLDKFAFFKTHVSAIWYNKLANITLKQKLDEMDAGIQDVSVKIPNTNVKYNTIFRADCNEIITPGIFEKLISNNATNGPGYWAYLVIFTCGYGYLEIPVITQVAIGYEKGSIAIRCRYDNVWTAWSVK